MNRARERCGTLEANCEDWQAQITPSNGPISQMVPFPCVSCWRTRLGARSILEEVDTKNKTYHPCD